MRRLAPDPQGAADLDAVRRRYMPTTDCDLVLTILRAAHGDWVPDLYGKTRVMVHSRVAELRKRGHRIECKMFGPRDYRYRLVEGQ